jgi:hypothetical protein
MLKNGDFGDAKLYPKVAQKLKRKMRSSYLFATVGERRGFFAHIGLM